MPAPVLAFLPLTGDLAGALAALPAAPGVGRIVAGERGLLLGMPSNLRRWAASHLGLGQKPASGRRPRTDLSGIATAVGWIETDGPLRQRLCYERLMAPLVPVASRRDLKPPAFLCLDIDERFPRVRVGAEPARAGLFGPFRDRRAAERARDAMHRMFPLRPCDAVFEPDPALALGLGCLHAQVRSCSAPCLSRIGEEEYRELASRAAAWLADARERGDFAGVPSTVTAADSSRALVVDVGRTTALIAVRGGRVQDEAVLVSSREDVEAALRRLVWPATDRSDDWAWLAAWLRAPKSQGCYLPLREDEDETALAARVRAAWDRFGDKLAAKREGT